MTVSCALVQLVVILAMSHIAIQCCTCCSLIEPYPANLAKGHRHVLHTNRTWIDFVSRPPKAHDDESNCHRQHYITYFDCPSFSSGDFFFMCHTCSGHRGYMCLFPCSPYLLGQTLHTQAMRFVWTSLSQAMAILESTFFPDTPCTIPMHLALPRAGHKFRAKLGTNHTLHITLYTPHCAFRTLHSHFIHTLHYTLYTPHFTLHIPHSALHPLPHSTVYCALVR